MNRSWLWPVSTTSAAWVSIRSAPCLRSACMTTTTRSTPSRRKASACACMVSTVGRNLMSSECDIFGVLSWAPPTTPIRTLPKLRMSRSLKPGSSRPSAPVMLAANSGNFASAIRFRNTALPKSNSWLPGTKMSGPHRVGQRPDVGALIDARHQRRRQRVAAVGEHHVAALGALGLDHRSEAGEAAAAPAVRHQRLADLVDVVGQHEADDRAVRPCPARRQHGCGGKAKGDGAAGDQGHCLCSLAVPVGRLL